MIPTRTAGRGASGTVLAIAVLDALIAIGGAILISAVDPSLGAVRTASGEPAEAEDPDTGNPYSDGNGHGPQQQQLAPVPLEANAASRRPATDVSDVPRSGIEQGLGLVPDPVPLFLIHETFDGDAFNRAKARLSG